MDQYKVVKKLKLNVTNINSTLIRSNKELKKIKLSKQSFINDQTKQEKLRDREQKLESPMSPLGSSLKKVGSFILQGPMTIFDKVKEFLGLILLGILVNNLPKIIEQLKKVTTKIGEFLNSDFIKGLGKLLSGIGNFIVSVSKGIASLSVSSVKGSETKLKEAEKLIQDLSSKYDKEDKELQQYYEQLKKEKNQSGGTPKPTTPTTSDSFVPEPLKAPSTPLNPNIASASRPGSSPFQMYNTGGTVQPDSSKNKPQQGQRTKSLSSTRGETGKEKQARESVNYFETFNKTVKESVENTITDKKNVKLFEEMANNFREFALLMPSMMTTPPPPPPGPGPGGSPFIQMDGKLYEATGGQSPNQYKSSNFGWRWGRQHQGVDYAHPTANIPVSILQSGTVTTGYDPEGWGNYITIKHENGAQTLYGHLSKILVQNGQKIKPGTVIGNQGSSGRSTGPHVHFEYRPGGPGSKATNGESVADSYFRFGGNVQLRELAEPPKGGMPIPQLIELARNAGFSENQIPTAVAVALAESGGDPRAHRKPSVPPHRDDSYGLWQINMLGGMGPERRKKFGLTSNEDLFNPVVNAKVAYLMSGGSNFSAWSTYSGGKYKNYLNLVQKQLKESNSKKKDGKGGSLSGSNIQPVKPLNKTYTKISSSTDYSESQSVFMIARQVVEKPVVVPVPIPIKTKVASSASQPPTLSDLWMM